MSQIKMILKLNAMHISLRSVTLSCKDKQHSYIGLISWRSAFKEHTYSKLSAI